MAKSKIIKDVANGNISLKTALKRAKVLLYDLENEAILQWINHEISGYPDDVELPSYRKTKGQLKGSYLRGTMSTYVKYTDVSLPLGTMPDDIAKPLLEMRFKEGVETLAFLLDGAKQGNNTIGKPIPADLFSAIAHYNNDPFMSISSAYVYVSSHCIQEVLDEVENKLLDILLLLEEEFGNLDSLDIDSSDKTPEELDAIMKRISVNIYDDHRVVVGEGATVRNASISSG